MSTLATRISGYLFTINVDPNGYAFGMFNAYDPQQGFESIHDLPFELRSTYSQKDGQTIGILAGAIDAVETLTARVEWTADLHQYDARPCQCEPCRIASAIFSRTHMVGRKSLI